MIQPKGGQIHPSRIVATTPATMKGHPAPWIRISIESRGLLIGSKPFPVVGWNCQTFY
jgi:hypothetical protein